MKTIKIILLFITTLIVVFLATGLYVKETKYTAQVSINKPITEVFEVFNNPENSKNWIPEIKFFEVINNNPGKIGSMYKIVIDNKGSDINMTEKVLAYVPNQKITLLFNAENMLKTDDYLFTEKGNTTTLTLRASCQSETYLMACIFPYFKGTFKKQDQAYLTNFKKFIEQKPTSDNF